MDIPGGKNDYGISDPTPRNAAGRMKKGDAFDIFWGRHLPPCVDGLRPQLVIEQLKSLGIEANAWLLADRARKGLIPEPYVAGCGRGKGKITLYTADTPAEYYASEKLRKILKTTLEKVKEVRSIALQRDKKAFWQNLFEKPENIAAYAWLAFKAEALGKRLPIFIRWQREHKHESGVETKRLIKAELFPLTENIPEGFDFLEVLKTTILTEDETPDFSTWWKTLERLEQASK